MNETVIIRFLLVDARLESAKTVTSLFDDCPEQLRCQQKENKLVISFHMCHFVFAVEKYIGCIAIGICVLFEKYLFFQTTVHHGFAKLVCSPYRPVRWFLSVPNFLHLKSIEEIPLSSPPVQFDSPLGEMVQRLIGVFSSPHSTQMTLPTTPR